MTNHPNRRDSPAANLNRERVAKTRQRRRDAGLVPKERWAHPSDWPMIDALIKKLTQRRS